MINDYIWLVHRVHLTISIDSQRKWLMVQAKWFSLMGGSGGDVLSETEILLRANCAPNQKPRTYDAARN